LRKALDIDTEAAYEIAYEGMIKSSLALMLSYGERPRSQPGRVSLSPALDLNLFTTS
jgi:hypothetical protein